MKYTSLITENIPTLNREFVYETGYFNKIKEHLTPYIEKGACYVSLDRSLDSTSDEVKNQDKALKNNDFVGIVKSMGVIGNKAEVDIKFFSEDCVVPDNKSYHIEFLVDVNSVEEIKKNNNHVRLEDLKSFQNVVKLRTW